MTRRPRSVTRENLTNAVKKQMCGSRDAARQMVDDIFEEIVAGLSRGEDVLLSGFGKFTLRSKTERMGRNPRTGQHYKVAARRSVTFKAADQLKKVVANPAMSPSQA